MEGNYYGCFDLPIYGKHQLLDALSCIAVCFYERLEAKEVQKIFKTFKGARRRFTETIVGDSIIIDDYAHHPNEVSATIHAVKQKYEGKKVITIFQPHTFSRTQEFMEDFARVFGKVDEAYFLEIHPAREKQEDYPDIKSESLVEKLSNGHLITMEESEVLCQHKGAVFVFMSPNDLSVFENKLIERLK